MSKKPLEHRIAHGPIELRRSPDGKPMVRGYAAVYDSEEHGEVIRRGAFDRTISQRDDIRLLINHDGVPLARTKSGTLTVGTDDIGLWFEAELDDESQTLRDLVSALERGDIDQCSFAGYFSSRDVNGVREVFEVKAVDVSIVTYPWYSETSVGLTGSRDADRALVALRALSPDEVEEVLALIDAVEGDDEDDEGMPDDDMPCESCGYEDLPDGAKFCPMCGAEVGAAGTEDPEPAAEDEPRGMSLADARSLLASLAA